MTALTCSPSLACCPSGTIPWTPPGDNFLVLAPKSALSSDWLSNINILPPWPNIRGTIPLTIDFTFIKNYWYTGRKKKYECNRSKGIRWSLSPFYHASVKSPVGLSHLDQRGRLTWPQSQLLPRTSDYWTACLFNMSVILIGSHRGFCSF